MVKRLSTVLLSVALVGSPLAALNCGDDGPAAMACCQGAASECNQPGKTDDCCRVTPGGRDSAVVAEKNLKVRDAQPIAVLPVPVASAMVGAAPYTHVPRLLARPADLSPPRSPILRI